MRMFLVVVRDEQGMDRPDEVESNCMAHQSANGVDTLRYRMGSG